MPIHVVARGALIGGGVGAAIAALRGGKAQGEATGSEVVRYAKSIAEGALAGAGVAFVLDRRSRARASALISEHGPTVLQAVGDLADAARRQAAEALDAARTEVAHAVESARPAVAHAVETAGPALAGAVAAARPTLSHAVDAARPAVSTAVEAARHRATHLRAA